MNFLKTLQNSIKSNLELNAFCIDNAYYTYSDLFDEIIKVRSAIREITHAKEKLIGLVTNDDIETYASILALWFEGKAYVPVNPLTPITRNKEIFKSTNISHVIDSSKKTEYTDYKVIESHKLAKPLIFNDIIQAKETDLAYILFTSGSTGTPKGVPITYDNLQGLVTSVEMETEFKLMNTDKCLQMFELTFDFSVVAYLFPLLSGACIYTIPKNVIKYFYIFKLIKNHKLTVLTMVPSIINYLRPYFKEIQEDSVRYCSFGGGALHDEIAEEWSKCLPNCQIFNYYGPTEFTVYSGYYLYNEDFNCKAHNGVISIGKPHFDTEYLIVDDKNQEVPTGITGELCLAGVQLTPGYWNNEERNSKSFFSYENNNDSVRYYKTGDLCFKDEDGNYMYVGRSDFQVKIRGYRVELSEVEFYAKSGCDKKINVLALDIENSLGNTELALAIESKTFDVNSIISYMKTKLPDYMIPGHIEFIESFPLSINGKYDRKKIKEYFSIS